MILNKEISNTYIPLVPYMPEKPEVGYGYVPYQIDNDFLDLDQAFEAGTLFPALITPYSDICKKKIGG